MKIISVFLVLLLLSLTSFAKGLSSSMGSDFSRFKASLEASQHLSIYEGLPHQTWDRELLIEEKKRKDTAQIWKFPFYTPSVRATNAELLRRILLQLGAIRKYGGEKLCGGYHPDFCVSWKAGEVESYALICFGCSEIVFYDAKESQIFDLSSKATKSLQMALKIYSKKRPKSL